MATDALRYRRSGQEAARAARARREKILLAGLMVVLAGLLAFEGPKTLRTLRGSSSPAPAPATATAPTPAPATTATPTIAPHAVSLKGLERLGAKDPFVPQIGATTTSGSDTTVSSVTPPAVRTSKFVEKDPFVQQVGQSGPSNEKEADFTPVPTPATPPAVRTSKFVEKDPFVQQLVPQSTAVSPPAPAPGSGHQPVTTRPAPGAPMPAAPAAPTPAAPGGGYIVIMASVPVAAGEPTAVQVSAAARARGVANVNIVDSSMYPTLRAGYYAVYSGPYSTLAQALGMLETIRQNGYASAYTRRLAR